MKITLVGLPQAGQQELFSLLTGVPLGKIKERPMEVHLGICEVKDPRIDTLSKMYKPKKTTYARIDYLLIPDFNLTGPVKDIIFGQLKNADEICFVVSASTAEKDVANFISELVLYDLMLVEKRLESIAKDQHKKSSRSGEKEKDLMDICKRELEAGQPLNRDEFLEENGDLLLPYQFFTVKPLFIVVNVPEGSISDTSLASKISSLVSYHCIQLCVGIEREIGELPEKDRVQFLQELGIKEPAINKMTRIAYRELGLISFFTVGEDEVRAWTVKRNSTAPKAGGAVHSDIEKGFVRAEMFKYDDLTAAGSEAKLKEIGKFFLKGRDYIVEDGDILSFRFNV